MSGNASNRFPLPGIHVGNEFVIRDGAPAISAKIPGGMRGQQLVQVQGLRGMEEIRALAMGGESDDLGIREIGLPPGTRVRRVAFLGHFIWVAACPGGERLSGAPFRVGALNLDEARGFIRQGGSVADNPVDQSELNRAELTFAASESISLIRSDSLLESVRECLESPLSDNTDEDLSALPGHSPSDSIILGARYVRENREFRDCWGNDLGGGSCGYAMLPIGTLGRMMDDELLGAFWMAVTPQGQWLGVNSYTLQLLRRAEDRSPTTLPRGLLSPAQLRKLETGRAFDAALGKWWEMSAISDLTPALAGFDVLGVL